MVESLDQWRTNTIDVGYTWCRHGLLSAGPMRCDFSTYSLDILAQLFVGHVLRPELVPLLGPLRGRDANGPVNGLARAVAIRAFDRRDRLFTSVRLAARHTGPCPFAHR